MRTTRPDHDAPGSRSATTTADHGVPGKRTLTESLPLQHKLRADPADPAHASELAAHGVKNEVTKSEDKVTTPGKVK